MSSASGLSFLAWDSDFFRRRIARVEEAHFDNHSADRILAEAREQSIDCLYLLVDSGNPSKVRAAERAGFHLVDIRVTREREVAEKEDGALPEDIDLCRLEDMSRLRAIARESHRDSRFYHDPSFPTERCDALYETWIENACAGAAAAVVVARRQGQAVGYIACEIPRPRLGALGLVAVAAEEAGRGHGRRMLQGALGWLAGQGCERMRVVTQARNIRASRLYEANGFKTVSVEYSYHLWLGRGAS